MNDTLLIVGIFLIIIGVYWYNSVSADLTRGEFTFNINLGRINDLKGQQNYAIATSVIGAIIAFAGAVDRGPRYE